MKIVYFDCVGGISGDMTVAALIDAGVSARDLIDQLKLLYLTGFEIRIGEDVRGGWRGTRVIFSMNSLAQRQYRINDILEIITSSPLPAPVKKTAGSVFQRLAGAEAKVRGLSPREVHFDGEEAVHSILAVVGSCLALFMLQVDKIYCSPLPVGCGIINSGRGIMPVPAPATAELMRGLPVRSINVQDEVVTSTGAAFAATLSAGFGPLPSMQITSIGYGIGSGNYALPNFLRVFVGEQLPDESEPAKDSQTVLVLETDIDDMNPEFFPYVDNLLRRAGALDVFLLPTIMKKGRPGTRLAVLCPPALEEVLIDIIFRETTTLGVRIRQERRRVLNRRQIQVQTPWGQVGVKVAYSVAHHPLQVSPEYEDCRRLAESSGRPVQEIYHAARQAAQEKLRN